MRSGFALLLVGALVVGCQPKPAARHEITRPFLWSLEKDGRTSYLLGTMHQGVDGERDLPAIVWQKLDEAPAFAMETDLSGHAQMDVLRKDGTTLRDELGPAYWKKLEDALGIDTASRLLGFKPMVPATLLSMKGLPETNPMDGRLHARALGRQKRIVFLEPAAQQEAMLDKWMDTQALKAMLDDLPATEAQSKAMLAAYRAGDDAAVIAVTAIERTRWIARGRPAAEHDRLMEDVLYRRNAAWVTPIENLHADGGGFIAVGALHAVGPRSVLDLLAQRGFRVTRLATP